MLIADRLSLAIVVPRALIIPAARPDFQLFKELQARWLLKSAPPL